MLFLNSWRNVKYVYMCERAIRVIFDADEHERIIVSIVNQLRGSTKLLGINFDSKLNMANAAHKCARAAA